MAINRKPFFKWILLILALWIVAEVTYQFYLHAKYVKKGDYNWEQYVVERNRNSFIIIRNYFSKYTSGKYYNVSYHPEEGNIKVLPDSVQKSILSLKADLLEGIDLFNTHHHFEIYYEKLDSHIYKVDITAGATFKPSYNGYDFGAGITNDTASISECEHTILPDVYVCREYLKTKEYHRPASLILRYNCNSYDLLILKLFR